MEGVRGLIFILSFEQNFGNFAGRIRFFVLGRGSRFLMAGTLFRAGFNFFCFSFF